MQGVGDRAAVAGALFAPKDAEVLVAVGLLHDVGYAPELTRVGFHPLDGARYLAKVGAPERVVNLVAHHSCAYREAELRGPGAELAVFTDEESPLRDALWWADMTTTPDGEVTTVDQRLSEIQARYGPEDLVTFFVRSARSELVGAVERTEERLRTVGIDYEK
ncbi:MAG: HD domain-containing protein [Sciscionella sp.]